MYALKLGWGKFEVNIRVEKGNNRLVQVVSLTITNGFSADIYFMGFVFAEIERHHLLQC